MKEIKTKKGFKFIKNSDEDIIRTIKEYFEEPKIFLKRNNKIGIGKESLRQRSMNITNEKKNLDIVQSLKGININCETGINLSSIPNISQIQKTINSKEDIPQMNNAINTISLSKEVNNNEMNNSKYFINYLLESKKENNIDTNKNINYANNNQNNKNVFNSRKGTINNKNIYCVTEENYNGKKKTQRIENFFKNINKDNKILLLQKKSEKYNNKNTKNKENKSSINYLFFII